MRRIGLMGGTFDPIHLGHLAAAEAARAGFGLEKVIFVPAGDPPHKTGVSTPGQARLEMVQGAVAQKEYFEVSDFEIRKPGKSYTIDTVTYFHRQLGEDAELFFITGSDAILEILTWRDVPRLMQYCRFIAVARPGYAGLRQKILALPQYVHSRVKALEVPGLHISSTQVRSRVQSGQSIRELVPENVASYIFQHGLYQN